MNDSLSDMERSKLSVWEYPISPKNSKVKLKPSTFSFYNFFGQIWNRVQSYNMPNTLEEALVRVRKSPRWDEGFAFIG